MCSYTTHNRKFQKNSKKIQKIRKHDPSFFSSQNRLQKAVTERKLKKKIVSMCSYPTRNRKLKKIAKKFKKLENKIIASFQAKIGCKSPRK